MDGKKVIAVLAQENIPKGCAMTDDEIKELAASSANMAVRQTFRMLGVDTEDQDSLNEFRSDLVFARSMRRTTNGVKSKILLAAIGIITAACLAALSRGFGFPPE